MKLQAMIDKKNELGVQLAKWTDERDTLIDKDENEDRQAKLLADILTSDKEFEEWNTKIEHEDEYEKIKRSHNRQQVHAERAQGSDMHLDMAEYIDKEAGGESGGEDAVWDALRSGELNIPYDMLMDEIFASDYEMQLADWADAVRSMGVDPATGALSADVVTRGTTRPRNRAVSPLVPPYQMDAFTSFLDVTPRIPTTDQLIDYPVMVWRTANPADVVAEGVAATLSNYTITNRSQNVVEVVAMADATKQALRDIPRLRSMLRGVLRADARQKTDRMIVGSASTDREFETHNRILQAADVLEVTEANSDKMLEQASNLTYNIIGTSYKMPNVVCIYGGDWGPIINDTIDSDKDAYFDGRELRLFARPVMLSAAIPTRTVISGAFGPSVSQLHIRQDPSIQIGQSGDDFEKRQYKMLLTYELAHTIYVPQGLMRYQGTAGNTGGWA